MYKRQDDTVLETGVRSFFKMRLIFNTLFFNPFRRKPIQDASNAFHHLIKDDPTGPVIYLSNSPWNLYEYLRTFLEHNKFPKGIICLRDMGVQLMKSRPIEDYNKYIEIEKMLLIFEKTNFILIGDSGEKDFDIYKAIAIEHPSRISDIIINSIGNRKKEAEIQEVINDQSLACNVRLVKGYGALER